MESDFCKYQDDKKKIYYINMNQCYLCKSNFNCKKCMVNYYFNHNIENMGIFSNSLDVGPTQLGNFIKEKEKLFLPILKNSNNTDTSKIVYYLIFMELIIKKYNKKNSIKFKSSRLLYYYFLFFSDVRSTVKINHIFDNIRNFCISSDNDNLTNFLLIFLVNNKIRNNFYIQKIIEKSLDFTDLIKYDENIIKSYQKCIYTPDVETIQNFKETVMKKKDVVYGPLKLYAIIILICDDYLQITSITTKRQRTFFNVLRVLPIELVMLICNIRYKVRRVYIKNKYIDSVIKLIYDIS